MERDRTEDTHLELVSQSDELIEVVGLVAVHVDLRLEEGLERSQPRCSPEKERKRRRRVQTHSDVSSNHISESFPIKIDGEGFGARKEKKPQKSTMSTISSKTSRKREAQRGENESSKLTSSSPSHTKRPA